MRNNSAGIRVTRARGRKQSKRSRGYSDLSAVTSGNGSVDKLRGTTISRRPCLKGSARGKRENVRFLAHIRFEILLDRENNYAPMITLLLVELFSPVLRSYQVEIVDLDVYRCNVECNLYRCSFEMPGATKLKLRTIVRSARSYSLKQFFIHLDTSSGSRDIVV